ncbi:MAG TPA: cell division protein FtsZ [Solirubrobacteraceae bacterium]|jgi:cell division protein FtsZ|nr:cell division protein FtsZ [Solirubrobacteraceae bacterium]
MTNAKRASMREGPLAALFRKTELEGEEAEGTAPAQSDAPARAAGRAAPSPPPHPRETGLPHPALSGTHDEPAADEPHVPSPRERLRHAFSSEIPENLMERPAPPRERYEPAPERYASHALPDRPPAQLGQPVIRVVGVGGGGVNAVNRMVEAEVEGIEFIAVNTDLQSLQQSTADITVHIGAELTRGLGSGSDANVGRAAAMEDYDRVKALLKGSDMIFITVGEGGGTGTGAAPILARISRELGALTVAIVTKPFGFEGSRRGAQAERGVEALAEEVDTLIVVPNDRLLAVLDKQTAMVEAFRVADDVLRQGVQGVSDLVTLPGLINLDFADVRTIMSGAGSALLGIGMGIGDNRATDAAMQAVSSPLLETSMDGARSILLSITGGENLSLWEVNEAAKAVSAAAHQDANIIFGAMVDDKLDDQVWVTVVATGYGDEGRRRSVERMRGGRVPEEEPGAGEVRVQRASSRPYAESRPAGRRRGGLDDLEVPEFIPGS